MSKKIWLIRNSWQHASFGGAESFTLELCQQLIKHNFDVSIVSGSKSTIATSIKKNIPILVGPRSPIQNYSGWRVLFLPLYPFLLLYGYVKYLFLFKKHQPDIVQIMSRDDYITASWVAKLYPTEVIWTDHGELKMILKNLRSPLRGWPGKLVYLSMRATKMIVLVSRADLQVVDRLTGQKYQSRLKRIYNGVDDISKESASLSEVYDYCFASRAIRTKGVYELLDSFSAVNQKHPNSTLLITSDKDRYRNKVENYIRNNNIEGITIKDYDDALIPTGKIFVLPSYNEAFSVALLKAMMFSRPIITTAVGGTKEMLKNNENALLVKPQTIEPLVDAMEKLLINSNLRKVLASSANHRYRQKYSLATQIKAYEKLYEDLF